MPANHRRSERSEESEFNAEILRFEHDDVRG